MQVFWLSHFKDELYLPNNEFTGTLPTEIGNMNELRKLLCTHCLNSLMDFSFCMIIFISLLWVYYLKMDIVKWPKYLTTCKSCEFLISKMCWICQITNLRVHFPLKWETWMNLVSYWVHTVSTLRWILYSVWLFVYLCYEYMIWIWRVLTDQNISPLASLVTFSFQRCAGSIK